MILDRRVGALAVLLIAGCGSFTWAQSVDEAIAGLPHPRSRPPRNDAECLMADALAQVVARGSIHLPTRQPWIVLRPSGDVGAEGITPAGLESRFVFLSSDQLDELHRRFGETQYAELDVRFDGPARAQVTVATTITLPPNALALCCSGEVFVYDKKDGRWIRDDRWIREVYY